MQLARRQHQRRNIGHGKPGSTPGTLINTLTNECATGQQDNHEAVIP